MALLKKTGPTHSNICERKLNFIYSIGENAARERFSLKHAQPILLPIDLSASLNIGGSPLKHFARHKTHSSFIFGGLVH